MSGLPDEYADLLGVKDKRIDPSKNPNYRRFTGLTNMVKVLKHDLDIIKNKTVIQSQDSDNHVKTFLKERQIPAFGLVINYYEGEIQLVKHKLANGIKVV